MQVIYDRNEKLEKQIDVLLQRRDAHLKQKQEREKEEAKKRLYYQERSVDMIKQMRSDMKRFSNF